MFLVFLLTSPPAFADCAPIDPAVVAREARALIEEAEPDRALALVVDAESRLACLDRLVSRDDLAALFQVGGKAAQDAGEEGEADRLYAVACRLAGDVAFDPVLGAEAAARYNSQCEFLATAEPGVIQARSMVRLDGWDLEGRAGRPVPPGAHLIQVLGSDGRVTSTVAVVGSGAVLEVGPPPPPLPQQPLVPQPKRRVGLTVVGASLLLAGGASLVVSGDWKNHVTNYPSASSAPLLQMDLLTFGGGAAIGVGTALLVGSSLHLSSTQSYTLPLLSGRW